jgi:hypothetical protein
MRAEIIGDARRVCKCGCTSVLPRGLRAVKLCSHASCFFVGTRCAAENSRLSGRGEDPVGGTSIASVVVEALIAACRHVLHSKVVGPSLSGK